MQPTTYLATLTGPFLLLALGCASDGGIIDPATRGDPTDPAPASARYSDWSPAVPLVALNSAFIDQQPALSKDGLTIYFASNRPTDERDTDLDQNIWVAHRACADGNDKKCAWGRPVALGAPVNGPFLDVSPALSRDEHQLFFASQRSHNHCPGTAPCNNRDLWVSYREDVHDHTGWEAPVNLGDDINSDQEEVGPSYFESEDGSAQLFFNRGELVGDIYTSELTNGVWSPATPVTEVNGVFSDQRPSISHDGMELYFWSNRPATEGGSVAPRIWLARRSSVTHPWLVPELVPGPINDAPTIMPFIHSRGRTETLLFVRPFSPVGSRDLWMSERTKGDVTQ